MAMCVPHLLLCKGVSGGGGVLKSFYISPFLTLLINPGHFKEFTIICHSKERMKERTTFMSSDIAKAVR